MKKALILLPICLLLTGCGANTKPESIPPEVPPVSAVAEASPAETRIHLADDSILISVPDGYRGDAPATITRDIIYYEDRETYDSGNPFGEGTPEERHTAEEAADHQVVNITKPGAYRVTGTLSAGQIRVDLGEDACDDPAAVVDLILDNADITCTVAPAILFRNVYECDGNRDEDNAKPTVDTAAAGANLILEGTNKVNGSHVAKIFKDKDKEKKLWKQDAAIYSYMSMNVSGPGSLELKADNEGMGTELHLTVNSGNIHIYSGNDGINTNEDGVSVTTINDGNLTIFAGLDKEGDGIDSNGYLVINGGTVVSAAHPASDAGLDSDLGSFIHGGTVIAMGSTMNWAESDSDQVTMNLQFAQQQKAGAKIIITREDGTEIFSFESVSPYARPFSGLILSHACFTPGEIYHIYVDGVQMAYTGTDVGRFGPVPKTEDFDPKNRPDGFEPDRIPGDFTPEKMQEDFDPFRMEGQDPHPEDMPSFKDFGGRENPPISEPNTDFYIHDKVNAFSGVAAAS